MKKLKLSTNQPSRCLTNPLLTKGVSWPPAHILTVIYKKTRNTIISIYRSHNIYPKLRATWYNYASQWAKNCAITVICWPHCMHQGPQCSAVGGSSLHELLTSASTYRSEGCGLGSSAALKTKQVSDGSQLAIGHSSVFEECDAPDLHASPPFLHLHSQTTCTNELISKYPLPSHIYIYNGMAFYSPDHVTKLFHHHCPKFQPTL